MLELSDTVFIEAPPGEAWAWLARLPENYRSWHPAHAGCRYLRGSGLEAGAVLAVEEELHGRPHRLKLRVDEVVPMRRVRYSGTGFRGAFFFAEANGGTSFTATLTFGAPILGKLADRLLARAFARPLDALRVHMHEEGLNLKRLLERGPASPRPR